MRVELCGECAALRATGSAMGPLAVLWCVSPACPTPNSPRVVANRPPARRETSVYTDEAASSLLAFTGHEAPAEGQDVKVLAADASPALEAALWAVSAPRGN